MFFLLAPNILDEVAIVVHLVYTYFTRIQFHFDTKTYRDLRIRWCHLSTIPGTTPHYLVGTEGNVNFLGTRNLVYPAPSIYLMLVPTQR